MADESHAEILEFIALQLETEAEKFRVLRDAARRRGEQDQAQGLADRAAAFTEAARLVRHRFKAGQFVTATCDGESVTAFVALVSGNGRSLALTFDGVLAGHVEGCALLRGDDGVYRSIINQAEVTLTHEASAPFAMS